MPTPPPSPPPPVLEDPPHRTLGLQRTRMFDMLHTLLRETVGLTASHPNAPPISRADIFSPAHSHRAIRACVFDLDPAQNVTASMQGRDAYHRVDLISALANL